MTNRRNISGIVEDIRTNTQVGLDDLDRLGRMDSNGSGIPSNWNEVEESNILLNPDAADMDRG